jgi:membrane protease YdiL (CAAX protease family)
MAQPEASPVRTEGAWRLIAAAIGWILLGFACSFVLGVLIGQIGPLLHVPEAQLFIVSGYIGSVAPAAVVLAAAVIRGRVVGLGNINAGLGNQPVSRLSLIVSLAVVAIAYAIFLRFALRNSPFYRLTGDPSSVTFWAGTILRVVVLDPVAEESLFRGWLWTGLQRHWGVLPTALFTSTFWDVLHFAADPMIAIALIPIAAILALARQLGQSVRAPIALHMVYNLATISATWLLHV